MKLTIALVCSCLFYQAFSQTKVSSPQCQGSILELVATSIKSHQSRLDEIEAKQARTRPGYQVAFSAEVSADTFTVNVLKYKNPFVNLGNALNATTGEFTAPVNGTYWFNFMGMARAYTSYTRVGINVNGVPKVYSGTNTPQELFTLATGAVFILAAGDVVDIRVDRGRVVGGGAHSTFSGFIIQWD